MILTSRQKDIIAAKICPYCNSTTKVVSEDFIYGRSYKGRSIICCSNYPICDSFVGTHSDGSTLGRLANKALRVEKIEAHKYFDKIWKDKHMDRSEAYEWLSQELALPEEYTHIGMFSISTCVRVVELSRGFIS